MQLVLVLLIVAISVRSTVSFLVVQKCNIRPSFSRITARSMADPSPKTDSTWQVDQDTSEIEWGSSADITRAKKIAEEAKIRAEEEARKKEEEKKLFESKMEIKKSVTSTEPSKAVTIKNETGSTVSPTALSKQGNTGFDIGLLIAFPIIIGTLGFFFFFPFLSADFAKGLPPVPMTRD